MELKLLLMVVVFGPVSSSGLYFCFDAFESASWFILLRLCIVLNTMHCTRGICDRFHYAFDDHCGLLLACFFMLQQSSIRLRIGRICGRMWAQFELWWRHFLPHRLLIIKSGLWLIAGRSVIDSLCRERICVIVLWILSAILIHKDSWASWDVLLANVRLLPPAVLHIFHESLLGAHIFLNHYFWRHGN